MPHDKSTPTVWYGSLGIEPATYSLKGGWICLLLSRPDPLVVVTRGDPGAEPRTEFVEGAPPSVTGEEFRHHGG